MFKNKTPSLIKMWLVENAICMQNKNDGTSVEILMEGMPLSGVGSPGERSNINKNGVEIKRKISLAKPGLSRCRGILRDNSEAPEGKTRNLYFSIGLFQIGKRSFLVATWRIGRDGDSSGRMGH